MLMSVCLGSLIFVADGINSFFFLRQFQVVCVFLGGLAGVVTERRGRGIFVVLLGSEHHASVRLRFMLVVVFL